MIGAHWTTFSENSSMYMTRINKALNARHDYYGKKEKIDLINFDKISKYLDWRNKNKSENVCIRVEGDKISVFSNDLKFLENLYIEVPDVEDLTEALVLDEGVMYFKNEPKFKYRAYIKNRGYSIEFRDAMCEFIKANESNTDINISNGLYRQITSPKAWRYMFGSYGIDYNHESFLTYLHMLFPGMIGKHYRLEKQP